MFSRRDFLKSTTAFAVASPAITKFARAVGMPGVTDTEIKVGQTMPYSGPASAYGMIGRANLAYVRMINDQGGINGRKINLISLDDGYSAPKTVEQTRRLVEVENVAFIHSSLGTATNLAIRGYLNTARIPQLSILAGAATFNDPEHFPWTVPGNFQYRTDAHILTKQILLSNPESKIALIYQNDDFGRDYLQGVKETLGLDRALLLVRAISYEVIEPTIDSQIISLQSSGADTLIIAATPKPAAQAIRKTYDIGWAPTRYMSFISASIPAVLKPAGLEKSKDVATAATLKDPSDPTWADDPEMKNYVAFMEKYLPGVGYTDFYATSGYSYAENLINLLKKCGSDLSRENILNQATNIKEFRNSLGLPGVTINITPNDYNPYHQARLQRFSGESWKLFGDVVSG